MAEGDVILGRRGEMGRCALVTGAEAGFLCGTGSLFIRPNRTKIQPSYLARVLSSDSAKRYFEQVSLGATMPNLNKSIVGSFQFGVPPIQDQERFSDLTAFNSSITEKLLTAAVEANILFQSIQQKVFSGQL